MTDGEAARRIAWPAYRVGLLLLVIWVLVSGTLTWSSWQAVERYERHVNEQIEQRTRLVALMQSTLVDGELDAVDRDLRVIRERLVERLDEPRSEVTPILESSLDANEMVRGLWWLDGAGERVASRGRVEPPAIEPAEEPFFRAHADASRAPAEDKADLSGAIDTGETRLLAVSRMLRDRDGEFRGVLVAWIDLGALAALLERVIGGERLASMLSHRDGHLLLNLAENSLPSASLAEWIEASGVSAQRTGRFAPPTGDHDYQYALARPEGWPLNLIVAENRAPLASRVAENARYHYLRLLIWTLVSGALLLLVGWLFSRRAAALEQVAESERRLAESHRRNAAIIEAMPDLLFTMDVEGRILDFEPGEGIPLLMAPEEFLGRSVREVLPADLAKTTCAVIERTLATGTVQTYQYHLDFDGARRYYEGRCSPLTARTVLILIIDITARKRAESDLEWAASHDPLTGLPNRRLFIDRLELAVEEFHRYGGVGFCLLYLDLDGFKAVNDTLGHAAGDQLLIQVAGRLREQLRAADSVARLSGDEFVLIVSHAGRPEADVVAGKLCEELGRPYPLDEGEARVGVSIGMACCPEDGRTADTLMRAADADMYRHKPGR